MVTYYLGSPNIKREKLSRQGDGVYIDNDEVLAVYGKRKKYYFITGQTPFKDFTVWEYLSYAKSLQLRRPLKLDEANDILKTVGLTLNPRKKLSSLDSITLKAIKLALSLQSETNKVYLNLDGTRFSKKTSAKLKSLLSALSCYEVVVSISDTRFVPTGGNVQWLTSGEAKIYKTKIIKKGRHAIRAY